MGNFFKHLGQIIKEFVLRSATDLVLLKKVTRECLMGTLRNIGGYLVHEEHLAHFLTLSPRFHSSFVFILAIP